jgi:hypothetical protein
LRGRERRERGGKPGIRRSRSSWKGAARKCAKHRSLRTGSSFQFCTQNILEREKKIGQKKLEKKRHSKTLKKHLKKQNNF